MYILGLDCGGTSSQALLTTADGLILGRGSGGPANFTVNGVQGVVFSVLEAAKKACNAPGLDLHFLQRQGLLLALGISGASREPELRALTEAFQQEGFNNVVVNHDASIALLGALSGSDGVVVIAGTGSIAYGAMTCGAVEKTSRVGGWGYLLGDEGSAFWIAIKTLQGFMQGYDGRSQMDPMLKESVFQYFQISREEQLIPLIYKAPLNRGLIGGFSKEVTNLANAGHIPCQLILAQAGHELGRLALAALARLDFTNRTGRVAACGGVFSASHWILDPMQAEIWRQAPNQNLTLPDFDPVVGAVLLGVKHLDFNVKKAVDTLQRSLRTHKED